MKYIIYTLGCKVNQYETQAIEALLVSRGHKPCAEGEIADVVIVNTCAVTAEAGRKSRQAIHRLREENPGAVAAVLGCYSQLSPDAVQKLGADIVYGTADRLKLIDAVEKAVATGEGEKALDKPFERRVFEELAGRRSFRPHEGAFEDSGRVREFLLLLHNSVHARQSAQPAHGGGGAPGGRAGQTGLS